MNGSGSGAVGNVNKARMLGFGIIPDGDSPADFSQYVKDEIAKWHRVIEARKIDRI